MAERGNNQHVIDEETKKIRRTQEEKFRGKLSENDARCLLQLNNWDPEAAFKDFFDSNIKDLREKICDGDLDKVEGLKRDAVLRALEENIDTGQPKRNVRRQYTCGDCDRVWWYWTPARKPVSRCRNCRIKYDAIPYNRMFGWAIFTCDYCGNEFSGFGQMEATASECYRSRGGCGRMVYPTRINPPDRRHRRKSRAQHSCNAPDCMGYYDSGAYSGPINGGAAQSKRSSYRRGNQRNTVHCVHPKSHEHEVNRKKVLCTSSRHVSTGSTVATYLTQDDQVSVTSSYIADLQTIDEI